MKSGFQPTRSQTIFRHTRDNMKTETWLSISQRITETYLARVSPDDREIAFHTEGKADKCHTLNSQKLHRYMAEDVNVRMPVDLEESWVLALAEPYRSACLSDLAARYGLLAARIPEGVGHAEIADLLREVGEAVTELSKMYEDGKLDASDAKHLNKARKEIRDVVAACMALDACVTQAVEEPKLKAVK